MLSQFRWACKVAVRFGSEVPRNLEEWDHLAMAVGEG